MLNILWKIRLHLTARNGHSKKTVRSEYGNINLDIPRDRNAEFEPQIIPKYQREITGIEGQILSLYAKGMSNRDIEDHLNNLYGIDVSPSMISKITDKIIPEIREWQSRQLEDVYPISFYGRYPLQCKKRWSCC